MIYIVRPTCVFLYFLIESFLPYIQHRKRSLNTPASLTNLASRLVYPLYFFLESFLSCAEHRKRSLIRQHPWPIRSTVRSGTNGKLNLMTSLFWSFSDVLSLLCREGEVIRLSICDCGRIFKLWGWRVSERCGQGWRARCVPPARCSRGPEYVWVEVAGLGRAGKAGVCGVLRVCCVC